MYEGSRSQYKSMHKQDAIQKSMREARRNTKEYERSKTQYSTIYSSMKAARRNTQAIYSMKEARQNTRV